MPLANIKSAGPEQGTALRLVRLDLPWTPCSSLVWTCLGHLGHEQLDSEACGAVFSLQVY